MGGSRRYSVLSLTAIVGLPKRCADVTQARDEWDALKPEFDSTRLVFLDEIWTKTNMTRLRGRAIKGCSTWCRGDIRRPRRSWPGCAMTHRGTART